MRDYTRWALFIMGAALAVLMPDAAQAQRLPPRSKTFDVVGTDSATGQRIEVHLDSKATGRQGRQYTGTCRIKANDRNPTAAKLVGEWQFVQNTSPDLAGATRPVIGGLGTPVGGKPTPRQPKSPTAPGQVINFTLDPLPDGRYSVLLMDTFNDDMLEFKSASGAK
jgi:hypothetical protein